MEDRQIIQQISTICDELPSKMKTAKEAQHKTNQQIIDSTGLSASTVNKFFSGALANPSIYAVTAMCIDLGLSLDDLMELSAEEDRQSDVDRLQLEVTHQAELLAEKETAVSLLQERSRMMEREIMDVRRTYKPLLYGLCGLCILLTAVMMVYIVLDSNDAEHGLIRPGETSALIWLVFVAIIISSIMIVHTLVSRWYKKNR